MDYYGQKLCEYIYSIVIVLLSAVAWVLGFMEGDFTTTFYVWSAALVIALLVSTLY